MTISMEKLILKFCEDNSEMKLNGQLYELTARGRKARNSKIYINVYGGSVVNKLFALSDLREGATEDGVLEKLLVLHIAKLSYDTESLKLINIDPIEI